MHRGQRRNLDRQQSQPSRQVLNGSPIYLALLESGAYLALLEGRAVAPLTASQRQSRRIERGLQAADSPSRDDVSSCGADGVR